MLLFQVATLGMLMAFPRTKTYWYAAPTACQCVLFFTSI